MMMMTLLVLRKIMLMMMMLMMMMTCSGELVVNVRLCGDIMAEPPGLTRRPKSDDQLNSIKPQITISTFLILVSKDITVLMFLKSLFYSTKLVKF